VPKVRSMKSRRLTEGPLKISIAFADDDGACSAEVLIRHVASEWP